MPRRSKRTPTTSKVVQLPGTKRRRQIASINPDSMRPGDIDIAGDLRENFERYSNGDEWLSVTQMPRIAIVAADKVRKRVKGFTPGFNPTIACCIWHSIEALNLNPDVQSLLGIKDRFDTSDFHDGMAELVVASFFQVFPMTVAVSGGGSRRNICVPTEIKTALGELADDIGITKSSLASLCVLSALCDQPEVNPQSRTAMSKSVGQFMKLVSWKARGCAALMKILREVR